MNEEQIRYAIDDILNNCYGETDALAVIQEYINELDVMYPRP